MPHLFDPNRAPNFVNHTKRHLDKIRHWCAARLPEGARVSAREEACGDPQCSPVDTIIDVLFPGGTMKSVGIPAEAQDVTEEILDKFFPTTAVVTEWAAGRDAAWPPEPEPPTDVVLRFPVGARVEACCGPQQWKPGRVVQHWYRQVDFPREFFAPYQLQLDDGGLIFAPEDSDKCVRAEIAIA
mmetsp:Transcript_10541/g.31875  ORF Transcript_10541/g.31875 Transcript_10541/m.31875 type:complete len:184 (+) Transcript_10541:112-663(+)